jgi:hypothetical protein
MCQCGNHSTNPQGETTMFKYEITIIDHFDVWGNAKDGWEVNNSRYHTRDKEILLKDRLDEKNLLKLLKKEGLIKKTAKVKSLNIDWRFNTLYVNDNKNDYPLYTVHFEKPTRN